MTLVYDKSFEGFLTLIYEVYYKKIKVTEILKDYPKTLILDDIIEIQTNEEKASKVLEALKNKFPKKAFQSILNIFMCDSYQFEKDLLTFIILGFKNINELFNINNSSVFFIQNLEKELFHVNHKMIAFVRFEELDDGILYSKVKCKFNLIYFLGKHFYKRFNNQRYIIHDIDRKIAFIKNDTFTGIKNISAYDIPKFSKDEEKFQKLWKSFFHAVSIEERKNTKHQKKVVPLLYRTYMNEFH